MSFAAPLLGGIGTLGSLAGGFLGGAGTLQAGRAASAASNYQAMVAANNAVLANEAADRTLAAGAQQTQDVSMKSAANVGAIKAAQAGGGIDVNSGTALDVQSSARELGALASTRTMENAQERSWGYRVQASNDVAQAQLDLMQGKNQLAGAETAATTQELGGLGTGLLGAAQALSPKWAQGIFGS
jgi:hypothetical protein